MADKSAIEWTDATWNPIVGCSVISPGCTNCYAMTLAGTRLKHHPSRVGLTIETKAGPVWNGAVRFMEQWLDQPLRWKRPRKIFVCAHGDLFHENVPDEWIDRVFAVMVLAPQHTFQVLTKRAQRMREYLNDQAARRRIYEIVCDMVVDGGLQVILIAPGFDVPPFAFNLPRVFIDTWPLPNVWLGVSTEDQQRADERIPHLLATPAAKRFISAEPLLGAIDLRNIMPRDRYEVDVTTGYDFDQGIVGNRLDWVIVGGESGKDARPMHPDWARRLRDQCQAAGVPFFFKQWGEWVELPADEDPITHPFGEFIGDTWATEQVSEASPTTPMHRVGKKAAGALLDGREWREFPA